MANRFMFKFSTCLCLVLITIGCSGINEGNNKLIEKLNSEIKSGSYELIYEELSDSAKRNTPKEEFLERINKAVEMMKQVDSSISFQKDNKVLLSNEMSDLYFEYRKIEKNGKKLDVVVTIDLRFQNRIYDMCVSPPESDSIEYQVCITNALRKI